MRGKIKNLIITGLIMLAAVVNLTAQTFITLPHGSEKEYFIDRNPNIVNYTWSVHTDAGLTLEPDAGDVSLSTLGEGREHEIGVSWNTAGIYYLTVRVLDANNCSNVMAFPFRIISELEAIDDELIVFSGETENINLLNNDIYTLPLNIELLDNPAFYLSHFELTPEGVFTYTANENYIGIDTLRYSINNELGSDTAYIIVDVQPKVNFIASGTCTDEMPYLSWRMEVTGTELENVSLTIMDRNNTVLSIVENAELGGNMLWPDIFETGTYPIWGIPENVRSLILKVEYNYGHGSDEITLISNAPDCHINRVFAVWDKFEVTGITQLEVLLNDYDPDGDEINPASITIVDGGEPINGETRVNADGTITYIPEQGYTGPDSLIYRVCDTNPDTACDTAIVRLDVIWVDHITAQNDDYSIYMDQEVQLNVTANDHATGNGIDPESISIFTQPVNGNAVAMPNGTISYTPMAGFEGTDSLVYQICTIDEPHYCDIATVYITLRENQCVIASRIDTTTRVNESLIFDMQLYAHDPEDELDLNSLTVDIEPFNGNATVNPDFSISYTPNELFAGLDSFMYSICDAGHPVCCDFEMVYIEVLDMNQPIVANSIEISTPFEEALFIDILANVNDPEDEIDIESLYITEGPENGSIEINDDGTITYTPNEGFEGTDSFTYNLCDMGPIVSCASALVTIEVEAEIRILAVNDFVITDMDKPVNIEVLANDSSQFAPSTLTVVQDPLNGYSVIESDYSITYYPDFDFSGLDSFIYVVCTPELICDSATVTISIEDVVIPPQLFTPNGDGKNDRYVVRGLDLYPENELIVYNRWGNVVYRLKGYYDQWDGYSNVGGTMGKRKLTVGVYYYILTYGDGKEKGGALFLER
jgi:gliding motility-associated-like protein